MARKTALNEQNLTALGPEKLARLILGEAGRSAPFRKIVNAALAAAEGPEAVARQVERRLAALEKARGFIDWQKVRSFSSDLAATLQVVLDEVASASPALAAGLLLRFIATSEEVFGRVDDSGGRVQTVYGEAVEAFAALVPKLAEEERRLLPGRITPLLADESYGYGRELALAVIPALPPDALAAWDAALAGRIAEIEEAAKKPAAKKGGRAQGHGAPDPAVQASFKALFLLSLRQAIAEARGDLDALVTLEQAKAPQFQNPAALAESLLEAGRAAEALDWVRRGDGRRTIGYLDAAGMADGSPIQRFVEAGQPLLEARILDALDRKPEAQALRWKQFEAGLDPEALRAYVERLGDFEEFDALDRAFAHARASKDRYRALVFFLSWPRADLAAAHVLAHATHWDGKHYELLGQAAELLEDSHALAASVLYRALINDILLRSRSQAYGHGARYLLVLDGLAKHVTDADFAAAGLPGHEAYRKSLAAAHGRKSGFWGRVKEIAPNP